jgi:hypothetical protein
LNGNKFPCPSERLSAKKNAAFFRH